MADIENKLKKNGKKIFFLNYCVVQGSRLPGTKMYEILSSFFSKQIHILKSFLRPFLMKLYRV